MDDGSHNAVVALDRDAARSAISAAAGRFTALLRETDDIERPAAGTDWTVAETAAHVSCLLSVFSAAITGELPVLNYLDADLPTRVAATNTTLIATPTRVRGMPAGRAGTRCWCGSGRSRRSGTGPGRRRHRP